ncbi:MAG: nodulation protein NfeD [bacterium]
MNTRKSLRMAFFIILMALGVYAAASPAPAADQPIYRISLEGDIINPASAEYIIKAIDKAEADNARFLIIELDTPGGLLTSTREIVKKIMNARVPVVTYVAPMGARAGSAGVFITLASHIAAMAPSTNIGAAHPVVVGGEKEPRSDSFEELLSRILKKQKEEKGAGRKKPAEPDAEKAVKAEPMDQKILNDTRAWAEAIAEERGRNVQWARDAVVESVSATETEAVKLGVVDFVAADIQDLLKKLDGRTVTAAGRSVTLKTADASVSDMPMDLRLRLLVVLAHPNVAYILLMLGFYGLLFEITHPGAIFPGVAGAVSLILAFFGLEVLPTNYAGVALIVLAIVMFVAEIKVTSYGLLTIGGLASLVAGSLMLFTSPHEFMRVSLPLIAAFTLATLAVALFLAFIAAKSQRRRVATGIEGMIGAEGEVRSWSGETGKVFLHGETWAAIGPEGLTRGAKVEVVEAKGMQLVIKTKSV